MFERLAPLNPVAHNHICGGLLRLVSELRLFFPQMSNCFVAFQCSLQLYVPPK